MAPARPPDPALSMTVRFPFQPGAIWRLQFVPQSLANFDDVNSFGEVTPPSLLVGGQDGRVRMFYWDKMLGGQLETVLDCALHDGSVEKLEWEKDLNGLMSCSSDGTLKVSDFGRGAITPRHTLTNPTGKPIQSFVWSSSHAMAGSYRRYGAKETPSSEDAETEALLQPTNTWGETGDTPRAHARPGPRCLALRPTRARVPGERFWFEVFVTRSLPSAPRLCCTLPHTASCATPFRECVLPARTARV